MSITSSTTPNKHSVARPLHSFALPPRERTIQPIGSDPSRTKQEFKDDCDINNILAKFQRTGAMQHFAKYAPLYGEFSSCDLQTSLQLIQNANRLFDELPSSIRNHVSTPQGFLDFVQDPKNKAKMQEFGLIPTPKPIETAPPAS